MKRPTLPILGLLALLALSCGPAPKDWAWTEFRRPENARPVIAPDTLSCFDCPMKGAPVRWEFSDTFNPAAAVKNDSIIGTIFSPINGKDGHKVIDNDEVSEDIAKMTTTDFIQNISKEEELDNTQGFMDAQYEKTAKQEMPKLKEEETDYYVEKPIITPGESETTDTYENLKLF
jgi:hypothetical protein